MYQDHASDIIRRLGENKNKLLSELDRIVAGGSRAPSESDWSAVEELKTRIVELEEQRLSWLNSENASERSRAAREAAYKEQVIREALLIRRLARVRIGLETPEPATPRRRFVRK